MGQNQNKSNFFGKKIWQKKLQVLRQKKIPNKILKVHVKFENRKNERTRKIPDHKKPFEFVVESHGREIVISNLNHKEKTKRNTRREFSCLHVAQVPCATGGSDDVTRLAPIDWY